MTHPTRRILVIHNPVAGRRRRKVLARLLRVLEQRGHRVRVWPTGQRGDARDAARTVEDVDVIVAAGGDGTVNEVVDGLAARGGDGALPAVGFLPLGTANVLAWELSLPRDPRGVARLVERGETLAVRPGVANGRRFFLMASAGIDARAVAAVKGATKRLIGGAAYVLAAVRALRQSPPLYTVTLDGEERHARTVIVTRARRYGGPFVLAPDAGLAEPRLHVVMLDGYGLSAVLRYGVALARGRLHRLDDVAVATATAVRIDGPNGDPVQLDGDVATALPVTVTLDDATVPFLVPGPAPTAR